MKTCFKRALHDFATNPIYEDTVKLLRFIRCYDLKLGRLPLIHTKKRTH